MKGATREVDFLIKVYSDRFSRTQKDTANGLDLGTDAKGRHCVPCCRKQVFHGDVSREKSRLTELALFAQGKMSRIPARAHIQMEF